MRRAYLLELVVVAVLFTVLGFIWLHPASVELLRGNASSMLGDGSDSVTNPWQYQLVLDTFRHEPHKLLFGAIYSDQITTPDGSAVYIPWNERLIVLALAPFMRAELMPTAVVWTYLVTSGLAMYACGRLLGWTRLVAFALAVAWAISPYTRARAACHIALVGLYFAPLAVAGIRILAGAPPPFRWSARREVVVAAALFLLVAFAAHYYVILVVVFAPIFIAFYAALLPRRASRLRALGRLVLAGLPATLFLAWTALVPVAPSDARHLPAVTQPEKVREEQHLYLHVFGARLVDYVAGDVRYGDRDLIAARRGITRSVRDSVSGNYHERTNGIRWTVLGAAAVTIVLLSRSRLRRRLAPEARAIGFFALVLGSVALAVSLGPQGLRYYDEDLGPAILVQRVIPAFRVANRAGVFVHLAALLGAGVFLSFLLSTLRSRWAGRAVGLVVLGLVVVEYLPLHPVPTWSIPNARTELTPPSGECGAGVLVPYTTFAFQVDEYYGAMSELRGTSCKLIHPAYLSPEDDALRAKLSTRDFSDGDRALEENFARCTGASWARFGLDAPEAYKQAFCADMGWTFVTPDACRGAPANDLGVRSPRECLP
ncbi:hypothetical protein AKJ09_09761 [Labilithrix luteola]|uniref:Glycosyltransferase RgtA/B/C/D-like domain-containing protein n=1 Tax=Labilithrix luteola TaxID=1391654 RepID=A0A0K1QBI8_9BACT|nr:hypothetical protein [Labilithrix luteola]AKV03098.1 hypothetical protein AKJ09_09761 [Labilithrix luteola]